MTLVKALEAKNVTDFTLLTQQYIDAAVEAWKREGTAEYYLNSLELQNKEKIFLAACLRHKKREPEQNSYD